MTPVLFIFVSMVEILNCLAYPWYSVHPPLCIHYTNETVDNLGPRYT
jgi:hypothetical protein